MFALFKLSVRIFRQNWKRNFFNVLSLAIALFFISSLLLLYKNYECAQIKNAYASDGTWDYRIPNASLKMKKAVAELPMTRNSYLINYSLTACLDPIAENERGGLSEDLADHWLLSLVELGKGASDVIPLSLVEGRWPILESEIVVPRDFIYAGKKLQSKDYKIGDTIELPVGQRLLPGDIPTQNAQLSCNEHYEPLGFRSFCITGIVEGDFRKIGNYVETAYIGNPDCHHDQAVLYVYSAPQDSLQYETQVSELAEKIHLPADQIQRNEAVRLALKLIETSNIGKQFRTAGMVLIIILLLIVCTIVITSQASNFQANHREFSIMMVHGCHQGHVSCVLWQQNLFVFLIAVALSTALNAMMLHFFSDRIAALLFEQGERYHFIAQFYFLDILLIYLLILVLVSILPFLFILRIDIRNIQAYLSGQAEYNPSLVRFQDTKVPVWIRAYARKKVTLVTLSLSLLMSILVLALGLVAARTILLKSRAEIKQYAADFYVVRSLQGGELPDGEKTILAGLPDHVRSYHYVGANTEFDMPNDKLTKELKRYYRNTDQPIRTSTNLFALNEEMFKLIKGDELISFEDFSEHNLAIFYNQASLSKEYATTQNANADFTGTVQLSENAPFYKHRLIDMSTYVKGDRVRLNRVVGEDQSFELELAGTTENYFAELMEDCPTGGLYVSEKTFFKLIGNKTYYEIMLISTSPKQQSAVADYLFTAASKYGYHVQDNGNLTKTVRISASIQLTFIYALMGMAIVTSLINCLSIWGFEVLQQRRMMAIRRIFGQSRLQGMMYMFFSKLFVLVIAALLFVLVTFPLIFLSTELFDFYGITLLSAGAGLFVAILFHVFVLFIVSLMDSRKNDRVLITDIL